MSKMYKLFGMITVNNGIRPNF